MTRFRPAALIAALATTTLFTACAPLVVGGAMVGGTLMATDRRTSGTQIEDQSIEVKASNRVHDAIGDRAHVNVVSYNRQVLITGEASSEADRATIEQAVQRVENVRQTYNEVGVMGVSSLTSRSNDVLITSLVKASFVDSKDLYANAVKVTTERGVVYLMGRVTEREAERASDLARSINGVQKVVKVVEIVSDAELAEIDPKAVPKSAAAR